MTATDLEVTGAVPPGLAGRYIRTGPNPFAAQAWETSCGAGRSEAGASAMSRRRRVLVRGSSGLGDAARVAAGIIRRCFDRRGRKGLRRVGQQLGWIVRHRLIRIDDGV